MFLPAFFLSGCHEAEQGAGCCVSELDRLLQRLCDADMDCVVVGAIAATSHGSSLVTRDLDEGSGGVALRVLNPVQRHGASLQQLA